MKSANAVHLSSLVVGSRTTPIRRAQTSSSITIIGLFCIRLITRLRLLSDAYPGRRLGFTGKLPARRSSAGRAARPVRPVACYAGRRACLYSQEIEKLPVDAGWLPIGTRCHTIDTPQMRRPERQHRECAVVVQL